MGRHAASKHPETPQNHRSTTARRVDPRVLVAALGVLVVVAGGLVWWLAGSGDSGCASTSTVRVTVAPELRDLAGQLLVDPQQLADGACAAVAVTTQEPLQTVADLGALAAGSLPEVWVPDSSLWLARTPDGAPLDAAGSLAT